jgi:hypothetical protein
MNYIFISVLVRLDGICPTPCEKMGAKKGSNMMNDGQMELGFEGGRAPAVNRAGRRGWANWWFARMRQVVDRARDWRPAPPARPEQMWFAATHLFSGRDIALRCPPPASMRAEQLGCDTRLGPVVAPLLNAAQDGVASQNNISAARRAGCHPYLTDGDVAKEQQICE